MKKILFSILVSGVALMSSNLVNAQVGIGGFPKSLSLANTGSISNATIVLERPDYETLKREDATLREGKMERTGITLPANIDFHKSGAWTFLPNGERIWKLSIAVPEAKGIVLMYEKYHLPKGVTLYLSNENGKQIVGGFTEAQNPDQEFYSNEPIIGSIVNIEMDILPSVDINDIKFLIKYAGAMYKGLEHDATILETDANAPQYPGGVLGSSASCNINAICPQADLVANMRKSVARILISPDASYSSLGFCSGSLINNTGNSTASCRRLFVTASHCDENNGHADSNFAYWQFRFNYLSANCNGTGSPSQTSSVILTEGGKFVSRSYYPSMTSGSNALVQDFLLLELNDDFTNIPDAYMGGWTRKPVYSNLEMQETYTQFTSLHHPNGDIMKLSASSIIDGTGTFNQTVVPATHWGMSAQVGGSAGGSSGSPLFDVYGQTMGVLSGGPAGTCSADGRPYGQSKEYSKFSYGWENPFDQTNFPTYAGAPSRLKDALDPIGSGVESLHPTSVASCQGLGVVKLNKLDDNTFVIYPNPSNSGLFNIRFNLPSVKNAQIKVVNALGQELKNFEVRNALQQSIEVDCSNFAKGFYLVNISIEGRNLTKTVVVK